MIQNYDAFCTALSSCGFSMGGGNAKGDFIIPAQDVKESHDIIQDQIRRLNPTAEEKAIRKFISGK